MPAKMQQGVPVTQIVYFTLDTSDGKIDLSDSGLWAEALDLVQRSAGCQRLYWGRSHEVPKYAQLHVVRDTLEQHRQFGASDEFKKFLTLLRRVTKSPQQEPILRHAQLKSWGPGNKALAHGAPFTGTAIYLNTTDAWDEGAWPLWTHIVRHVDGCLGGSGGPLLEPVETIPGSLKEWVEGEEKPERFDRCNIVYVGWETTKQHDDLHHTDLFAEHYVILRSGNTGFAEYGHVVFEGSRKGDASSKL